MKMMFVSSLSHALLVSLEDLNPQTEYLVIVRSISALDTFSSNVTVQLKRTGSSGMDSKLVVTVGVLTVIFAAIFAGCLYRFVFPRW
jgi:hypothetical protein